MSLRGSGPGRLGGRGGVPSGRGNKKTGSAGPRKEARRGALDEGQSASARGDAVAEFVKSLDDNEVMVLRLRDELYEGRWDIMLADLNDRLQGRPYIFKLASRIQDDIDRIGRLSRFERERKVDLGQLVAGSAS